MAAFLARSRWTLTLRGIAAIALGIAALTWPHGLAIVALAIIAAFAFFNGALMLVAAVTGAADERLLLMVAGVIGLAIGAVVIVWPSGALLTLIYVLAIWAVLTGLVEFGQAIALRRSVAGEWLLAVSGLLSIIFGLLLALRPEAGLLALAWLFGVYAICYGALLLALSLRLRTL